MFLSDCPTAGRRIPFSEGGIITTRPWQIKQPKATGARLRSLLACRRISVRTVSYQQVERDTERLGSLLLSAVGTRDVARFDYVGMPRGGLIVLGLLSYVLDLKRDALRPRGGGRPLVVVDDCCLTGFRFHEFLRSLKSGNVIFAHLYSPPEVRRAIETEERRVLGCFAARDLRDLSKEFFPEARDHAAWQRTWRTRVKGPRYWIGLPERVILPWNEPDRLLWNPVTRTTEKGWRLASPGLCLKNRFQLGLPPRTQPYDTIRASPEVAYRAEADEVLLCNFRTERVYRLKGVASAMWRALAAYGDGRTAAEYLKTQYDAEAAEINRDLRAFARELLKEGLLERVR